MIRTRYFAICPTKELTEELGRLSIDPCSIEKMLFSKSIFDRVRGNLSDQVKQAKIAFIGVFCGFMNENHMDPAPFIEQFDRFWHIHVFEDCEDLDESIP